jgi:NAD-dependent SIR2 family protein deacetylase
MPISPEELFAEEQYEIQKAEAIDEMLREAQETIVTYWKCEKCASEFYFESKRAKIPESIFCPECRKTGNMVVGICYQIPEEKNYEQAVVKELMRRIYGNKI